MIRLGMMMTVLVAVSGWGGTAGAQEIKEHVVYIGDSHSAGHFGMVMAKWLRKRGSSFEFAASGGTAPFQWQTGGAVSACGYHDSSKLAQAPVDRCDEHFKTPSFLKMLTDAPKATERVAIIAHGTNYNVAGADYNFSITSSAALIKTAQDQGFHCVWIGPPNMPRFKSKLDQFYQVIKAAIQQTGGHCTLIDSRNFSVYPVPANPAHEDHPDGVHYAIPWWRDFPEGVKAAEAWAQGLTDENGVIIHRGVIGELEKLSYFANHAPTTH